MYSERHIHCFGVKIPSGTLFAPPLNETGYGARHDRVCDPRLFAFVHSSPATHAVLTVLKAGESAFHRLLLTKQWFMYIEEHNHCFIHYFGVKTLSDTLFFPAFNATGLRG